MFGSPLERLLPNGETTCNTIQAKVTVARDGAVCRRGIGRRDSRSQRARRPTARRSGTLGGHSLAGRGHATRIMASAPDLCSRPNEHDCRCWDRPHSRVAAEWPVIAKAQSSRTVEHGQSASQSTWMIRAQRSDWRGTGPASPARSGSGTDHPSKGQNAIEETMTTRTRRPRAGSAPLGRARCMQRPAVEAAAITLANPVALSTLRD